jgi:hypothetical protein
MFREGTVFSRGSDDLYGSTFNPFDNFCISCSYYTLSCSLRVDGLYNAEQWRLVNQGTLIGLQVVQCALRQLVERVVCALSTVIGKAK